uniref:ATP-binding protein n=1 Tax=Enterococcus lactis TaxID=357441 RepID=UPI0022E6CFE8
KHDYQNLLFSLHSYIAEGDLEGLRSYYDQTILPTRQMMNLLIVQLHFPKPIELDTKHTVNLVRMLGIILDNAIEGASAAKKKKIELTIIKKNHSVMIRVINTTTNTLPLNQLKQKGFSTKTNPKNEGLGLFILDELTKTNPYLFLETSIENQRFSQTIYIQIK